MLLEHIDRNLLPGLLQLKDQWRPFPKAADRKAWQSITTKPVQAAIAKICLDVASEKASEPWPSLPASLYARITRDGNRTAYEQPYFTRRSRLGISVIAECLNYDKSNLDAVMDALWSICEESTWCLPAHEYVSITQQLPNINNPVVDLFASETGVILAEAIYLLGPELAVISPELVSRVEDEIIRRVISPVENKEWGWFEGLNNWTPWCCYNTLSVAMYVLDDNQRLADLIVRLSTAMDRYIAHTPEDGGCDEGPTYWNVGHLNLLIFMELIYDRTQGKINLFDHPKIKAMASYILTVHINDDWYANFSDGPARRQLRNSIIYHVAGRLNHPELAQFALSRHAYDKPGTQSPYRWLQEMLRDFYWLPDELPKASTKGAASDQSARYAWLDQLQILRARTSHQTDQGLTLLAKAGHNKENHNHNDLGHFMIYQQGQPCVVDAGVEPYTRDTFNPKVRYTLWPIRGSAHNAPVVNGIEQAFGREFTASDVIASNSDDLASLTMNLTAAYPSQAGLASLKRSVVLDRRNDGQVRLVDEYALNSETGVLEVNLLTPCQPAMVSENEIDLQANGRVLRITFEPASFEVVMTTRTLSKEQGGMYLAWGDALHRITLTHRAKQAQGRYELTFRPVRK